MSSLKVPLNWTVILYKDKGLLRRIEDAHRRL